MEMEREKVKLCNREVRMRKIKMEMERGHK